MAKGTGEAVWYNDGTEERCLALVLEDRGSVADLIVFDPVGGVSSRLDAVPHREPEDYGPEGGGVTWHGIV